MKAGHGSGNLECPAAHYYASQVLIFHTKSHNLTVRTVNQSGDKGKDKPK